MISKSLLAALMGVAVVGCGARASIHGSSSPAEGGAPSTGGASAAGGALSDAGDAGDAGDTIDGSPYGPAPVPTCTGQNSKCIINGAGQYFGASVITCKGVYFVGPWTLLLERKINGQFQVMQVQAIEEPGFGATFYDSSGPPQQLTYRVCTIDKAEGTKCGDPFTTFGPVDCTCKPSTCAGLVACFNFNDDGCGGMLYCGACADGTPCNASTHSCCPPLMESDGLGGCVCAPPAPCAGKTYWNTSTCSCEGIFP